MPLIQSSSRSAVGENIRREEVAGKPRRQALAIALDVQRRNRAAGGGILRRDTGGDVTGTGGIVPSVASQNPLATAATERYQNMPVEKLQELALRLPAGSEEARALQQVLTARRMSGGTGQSNQQTGVSAGNSDGTMLATGGIVPRFAFGGAPSVGEGSPWWERSEARGAGQFPSGVLHSPVAGRTDQIAMNAPAGSDVVPADVVSGIGEGNTLAGARVLQEMLKTGPFGMPMPRGGHGSSMPRASLPRRARGGSIEKTVGQPVPLLAAGGEAIIAPHHVRRIGGGSIPRGHAILDKWVKFERAKIAKTMMNLPGPKKGKE